jgi:hypothetical protein
MNKCKRKFDIELGAASSFGSFFVATHVGLQYAMSIKYGLCPKNEKLV